MNQDRNVTATFAPIQAFTLTIAVSGSGSVGYSPGGGTCRTTCTLQYDEGTKVVLTPNDGSDQFAAWGGACSGNGACEVTMDSDKRVTATFAPPGVSVYRLTIAVSGNGNVAYSPTGDGNGSCAASCTVTFVSGTKVTLTEHPGTDAFKAWGGACSGTQATCAVTMDADKAVSATFELVVTQPHFRLTVGVTGRGSVKTSGIDCRAQAVALFAALAACQGDYLAGSSVTLEAIPEAGVNFRNWDGACAAFGAQPKCTLTMDANQSVTATFSTNPVIGDLGPCSAAPTPAVPCEEAQLPGPSRTLLVSLSGADGGKVTGGPSGGALSLASARAGQQSISCGANSYVCYGDYTPGQSVTLRARPAPGFVFTGWTGACGGQRTTCTLSLSQVRKVTANFTAQGKQVRKLSMKAPTFRVQWNESTGRGRLIVTGRIAGGAKLTIDIRRPRQGPLVHVRKTIKRAGAFRIVQRLSARFFPKGARLLPGGKVVSIRGTARGFYVPMQVRTVQLRGPRVGVVRRSFASATRAGRTVPVFSANAKVAWANFNLEQQPASRLAVRVFWFWPNGQPLGSVAKANRATISSFMRSGQALPRGCWRAELRAGGKRIKRQFVRIGTRKC